MLLYPQKMIHPGVLNPLDCEQFLSFPHNQPRKHKNRAAKWRTRRREIAIFMFPRFILRIRKRLLAVYKSVKFDANHSVYNLLPLLTVKKCM